MKEASKHSGACLCGKVEFEFELDKKRYSACHCSTCRSWGGGPLLAVGGATAVKFSGKDQISRYDSSDWAERGFCKNCGSHLFYKLKKGDSYNIPVGIVDQTDEFKLSMQFFIDKKPESYSFEEKTQNLTEKEIFEMYL